MPPCNLLFPVPDLTSHAFLRLGEIWWWVPSHGQQLPRAHFPAPALGCCQGDDGRQARPAPGGWPGRMHGGAWHLRGW